MALKKLFKRFYAASSYTIEDLTLINNSTGGDLDEYFLFNTLSTKELKILNIPLDADRVEKTRELADYDIAHRYLHVCMAEPYNCGICKKCRRTLLTLDLIDKLDSFRGVFNIDYYNKNKGEYFDWMYMRGSYGDRFCKELSELMVNKYPQYRKTPTVLQKSADTLFVSRHNILNKKEVEIQKKQWSLFSKRVIDTLLIQLKQLGAEKAVLYGKNYRVKEIESLLKKDGVDVILLTKSQDLSSYYNGEGGRENQPSGVLVVCSSSSYAIGQAKLIIGMIGQKIPVIYVNDIISNNDNS